MVLFFAPRSDTSRLSALNVKFLPVGRMLRRSLLLALFVSVICGRLEVEGTKLEDHTCYTGLDPTSATAIISNDIVLTGPIPSAVGDLTQLTMLPLNINHPPRPLPFPHLTAGLSRTLATSDPPPSPGGSERARRPSRGGRNRRHTSRKTGPASRRNWKQRTQGRPGPASP